MMFRRLFPAFCLVTIWLGALPARADINIHIELRPRYNATPVHVPDPECPVNPDKIINIVLSPFKDPNTTATPSNLHLCGVDETVDSERLLAEWNGPYIFKFLNKIDSNASYSTSVYSVVSSEDIMTRTTPANVTSTTLTAPTTTSKPDSTTDRSNTSTTAVPTDTGTFTESNNTGLYSLFLSPPEHHCDNAALEAAARGEEGFYSIFIGTSEDFSAQKEIFVTELNCLKSYYGGQKPNLCATKLVTDELRGKSRMETMLNLFNFAYNEERKVSPNKIKQCQSSESTKQTIQQCSFFDTTSDVWFAKENQTVMESDGYVKAELLRVPNNKKAVCHVQTSVLESENAATSDDFIEFDGAIIFGKGAQSAEVYVGLKIDNIVEGEETFAMTVEILRPKRSKRSPAYYREVGEEGEDNRRREQNFRVSILDFTYKCINDEMGEWSWSKFRQQQQDFVQDHQLSTTIDFFMLQEDATSYDQNLPNLHWAHRCNKQEHFLGHNPVQYSTKNTLVKSDVPWNTPTEPNNYAEKLAKASIKLLDFLSFRGTGKKENVHCPYMSKQTVAMAMIKDENGQNGDEVDILIAGNLKNPFELYDEVDLETINYIVREEFDGLPRDIFILYPDATTFGQRGGPPGLSSHHAEMQIVKYLIDHSNTKKISHLGVSKTPCCNCNTVLRRVKADTVNAYEAGIYQDHDHTNQPLGRCSAIPDMFTNVPIASGKGSDKCVADNGLQKWCGSQFHDQATGLPSTMSWIHPLDAYFGNTRPEEVDVDVVEFGPRLKRLIATDKRFFMLEDVE